MASAASYPTSWRCHQSGTPDVDVLPSISRVLRVVGGVDNQQSGPCAGKEPVAEQMNRQDDEKGWRAGTANKLVTESLRTLRRSRSGHSFRYWNCSGSPPRSGCSCWHMRPGFDDFALSAALNPARNAVSAPGLGVFTGLADSEDDKIAPAAAVFTAVKIPVNEPSFHRWFFAGLRDLPPDLLFAVIAV